MEREQSQSTRKETLSNNNRPPTSSSMSPSNRPDNGRYGSEMMPFPAVIPIEDMASLTMSMGGPEFALSFDAFYFPGFQCLDSIAGGSTVAIDNKIEQAMDLVKRHLMYAVREEVEILKQQIGEMMERIGQLEYENTVLRAEAKPETLNKLLLPRVTQAPPAVGLPTPATAGTQAPQIPLQASTQPAVAPQAHVQPAVQQPVHPAPASQVSHPPTSHPAPQAAQHPPAT